MKVLIPPFPKYSLLDSYEFLDYSNNRHTIIEYIKINLGLTDINEKLIALSININMDTITSTSMNIPILLDLILN